MVWVLALTRIATATLEQAMIKSESEMFEDTLKDQARLAASAMVCREWKALSDLSAFVREQTGGPQAISNCTSMY